MSDSENAHFQQEDLPELRIPDDMEQFVSSDSDNETIATSLSPPGTPQSPTTPVSKLGSGVRAFGFSDSDESPSTPETTPKTRKKRYPQRFPSKHRGQFRTPSKVKPGAMRATTRPSALLQNCHLPRKQLPHDILLKDGEKISTRPMFVPHGSQIMDMDILNTLFRMIKCQQPTCYGSLQLHKYPFTDGLQSYLVLHCERCHSVVARFSTTPHLGETAPQAVNNAQMISKRACEVNTRALLALHTTSSSWQDLRLTFALLDLPVPQKNLNKRAMKFFEEITTKVSSIAMDLAAEEVRCRLDAIPSVIEPCMRCDVSFDASWHRRGHYSNQGFGAAIDAVSGKVLDFGIKQRVCKKCANWSEEKQSSFPEEYTNFLDTHTDCTINFTGTSQAMEGAIAVDLWKRSVVRNQLVYSTYIGDGDSSSFKRVIDSNPYDGLERVRNEECLGHVQRRVKKHLGKKSASSLSISKTKVERIGQLYALVVVQNKGMPPEEIQRALWTLVGHLGEDHSHCPQTNDSWCYFARGQYEHLQDSTVPLPKRRKPYCNEIEVARMTEVFKEFASLELCSALTMGKTQNANESLHSVVWHNSPKGKYVGRKSLQCSTALAVTTFNEGSLSFAAILDEFGIDTSATTMRHLVSMDRTRNLKRERAILETQKRRRRKLKTRKLVAEMSRQRREKTASKYHPGMFGTERQSPQATSSGQHTDSGDESDTICAKCEQRNCPIGRKRKVDDWIGCDLCNRWYHGKCVGVMKISAFSDTAYFCDDCEDSS